MPKIDPVIEKLTEISERIAKVETKIEYISEDLKEVNKQDQIQNKLLAEHIAGVDSVRKLISIESEKRNLLQLQIEDRLQKVETPFEFIQTNKKALIWLGGIASALAGIAKLIGLF